MDETKLNKYRLSDRIIYALRLAIEQKDIASADALVQSLEKSMTRNTGGDQFVERRNYPPEIEHELNRLRILKQS
jgi:hypothetical protein